jgi:hypothetical protein
MMKCEISNIVLGKLEGTEWICPTKLWVYSALRDDLTLTLTFTLTLILALALICSARYCYAEFS